MKTQKIHTLILGATFYGISKLMKNPQSCMLVERTSLVGSEFIDSLNEKQIKKVYIKSEFGNIFEKALQEKGFLSDRGEIYSAPALFKFCDEVQKIPCKIMFTTEIIEIKKNKEGYKVTCFNRNGFSVIESEEILDTTSEGILHQTINRLQVQKSLNLIISDPKHLNVIRNNLMNAYIFRFPVEIYDNHIIARQKIHSYWSSNAEKLSGCKIVYTANTFAYDMPYTKIEVDHNFLWIPGCGFDNLLHAIDEGQGEQ